MPFGFLYILSSYCFSIFFLYLGIACLMKVVCVHGDVHKYPLVLVHIHFRGINHRVEAVVNPHLAHPLILGTNWPGFKSLIECIVVGGSCSSTSWGNPVVAGEDISEPSTSAPCHNDMKRGMHPCPPLSLGNSLKGLFWSNHEKRLCIVLLTR